MEGSRPHGRPKGQWLGIAKAWMGMDAQKLGDLAPDRGAFHQGDINVLSV